MNETLRISLRIGKALLIYIVFGVLVFTTSCNPTLSDPVDPYAYFPLEIGSYRIYNVTEQLYSAAEEDPIKNSWREKDEVIRMEKILVAV